MKKSILLKAILAEAIKRNLEEMPQIKKFYTLTDDWENKANNLRGFGPKLQDVILKLESMENMNHFDRDDIMRVFKFARPQGANGLIKILLDQGVIMPVDGAKITPKQFDLEADPEDEFSMATPLPGSDMAQGIDLSSALRKIKVEKDVRNINFSIATTYKVTLPREEQRRLAVEYGSVRDGIRNEYPGLYLYGPNSDEFTSTTTYRATPYGFLKPFLEKKHYMKIPSDDTIIIKRSTWQDRMNNYAITDVFPTMKDFQSFVQANPKSFKVFKSPKNFDQIISKVESVGGTIEPIKTHTTIST